MVELLLRLETLLLELNRSTLLSVGTPVLLVGLVLWLSGDRFGGAIIGLLGGAVGATGGLFVGQWLDIEHTRCMAIGGALLALVSVLLRNLLVMILAALILAALSGGGYLAAKLDGVTMEDAEAQSQTLLMNSFRGMELTDRQAYLDQISSGAVGFSERLRALLKDTWHRVEPYVWQMSGMSLAGGIAALVLFWLLKKVVIALAYSVVGATATLMGVQTLLLGLGVQVLPSLHGTRWAAPAVFGTLVLIGWASQLISRRPKKAVIEVAQAPAQQTAAPQTLVREPIPRARPRKSLYRQAQLAKKRWGRRRRKPAD
ncbi:MAG: hypothetical protein IH892_00640 [Planctomycetes bacterium]|nr:hypothetical protein [Planctomycetota bacterium]